MNERSIVKRDREQPERSMIVKKEELVEEEEQEERVVTNTRRRTFIEREPSERGLLQRCLPNGEPCCRGEGKCNMRLL